MSRDRPCQPIGDGQTRPASLWERPDHPCFPAVAGHRATTAATRQDAAAKRLRFPESVLAPGNRSPSRRKRIARNHEVVRDGAALNVRLRAPRAVGKDFALLVAVFCGVRVNEQCGYAHALRRERLESAVAVRIRVADEHDLALHVDALLAQQFVVFRIAAVGVYHWRRYFAAAGEADPCRRDIGIRSVGIDLVWLFAQDCAVYFFGATISSDGRDRPRSQHVVLPDDDVFQPLLLPLLSDVLGNLIVSLGAGRMRHRSEVAVVVADVLGGNGRLELRFELGFRRQRQPA